MTDILEPGSGKSSLYGSTPVVIVDNDNHWLYGWTNYEVAKANDHHICLLSGICLDAYVAYMMAIYPQIDHLLKPLLDTDTIHYHDLLAIDRAVTLTQRDATKLEEINELYRSGKLTDKAGNPIFPTNYKAQ